MVIENKGSLVTRLRNFITGKSTTQLPQSSQQRHNSFEPESSYMIEEGTITESPENKQ
jgi:hypothetical protein